MHLCIFFATLLNLITKQSIQKNFDANLISKLNKTMVDQEKCLNSALQKNEITCVSEVMWTEYKSDVISCLKLLTGWSRLDFPNPRFNNVAG